MRSKLLTLFGGGVFKASDVYDIPESEAQALIDLYNLTSGDNWTDNTNWLSSSVANNWFGVTVVGGHVTVVAIPSNGLNGNISTWAVDDLPSITELRLDGTSVSGDVSGWTLPSSLEYLYLYSTSISGDVSGWTLPLTLIRLYLYSTSISGDISSWTLPSSLLILRLQSTSVTAGPDASGATGLQSYLIQDCSLSQAAVDAIAQEVYDNWAGYTYATPALNVGGDNAAPSGTYQDGDPPTTGKEYIYEIVNDPETTSNETWAVTYTA